MFDQILPDKRCSMQYPLSGEQAIEVSSVGARRRVEQQTEQVAFRVPQQERRW